MALTKAQVSLVTVATLNITPGGYLAELQAFGTQKEVAAFIQAEGLLNEGTNAEFVNTVAGNLGSGATSAEKTAFFTALEGGASRADATVDFANAQLVKNGSIAKVETATKSASTSKDLDALKAALVTPAKDPLRVVFEDKADNQAATEGDAGDTIVNIGKTEIDAGNTKLSKDYTFELKNQIGETNTFTGKFLSPALDNKNDTSKSASKIVLELRNLREPADSATPLKDLQTNGFGFTLDGQNVLVISDAIDAALTYDALLAAVKARVEELGRGENLPAGADAALYAKLGAFDVDFGNTKPAQEFDKNDAGEVVPGKTYDVTVKEIVLTDKAGSTLLPLGYSNSTGEIGGNGFTLFAQMSNDNGSESQNKIATNLVAENVGYGSQGGTVNLVGQSNSDKGIQELNVTATKGVWFTKLESQKTATTIDHLETVNVTGSDYFRVGTQKNDTNHLVALVDETFATAGLVDVQQLNASTLGGSVAVNSHITDAVINRFDLKDTGLYTTDDPDALIQYNLTGGNDVLQIKIDSEVVAYADTVVNINAGGGNDFVHLQIDKNADYGSSWLSNQQENNNINITATSGNNTIWTEGAGNATITTGSGSDRILVDNSGKQTVGDTAAKAKLADLGYGDKMNALYVFNAQSADIGDIVSNTDNGLNNTADVAQVFNTFKNTVSVTFKGFETKHVTIESTNYTTSTQQINQAIKKAILDDATLSKLLTVKEFAGNVLVVESLIDGKLGLGELTLDFVTPAANGTATTALTKGQLVLGTTDQTAADKAYAEPGAATPAAVDLSTATTAISTNYNTNKAFATDGAGAGTAEVHTVTLTAGKMQADDTLTFTVPSDGAGATATVTFTAAADLADAAAVAAAVAAGTGVTGLPAGVAVSAGAAGAVVFTFSNFVPTTVTAVGTTTNPVTYVAVAGTETIVAAGAAGITAAQLTLEVTAGALRKGDAVSVDVYNGTGVTTVTFTAAANLTTTAAIADAIQTAIDAEGITGLTASITGSTITIDVAMASVVTPAATGVNGFVMSGTGNTDNSATTFDTAVGTGAETTPGVAGTPADDVDGENSSAHSDNVVNAGAGTDVIVLGTGTDSNDTVVLKDSFGHNTIVNFDDTAVADTAGNGGDLLDFTSYLDANYGAAGQANVNLSTGTALNGNSVTVVDFSTLSGTTDGLVATDLLTTSINTTKLGLELNADFDAGTTAATKHVFLIHNDNTTTGNVGEYLVVTATSTAASADLAGIKVVGTLDFGAAQTFTESNFVDFA